MDGEGLQVKLGEDVRTVPALTSEEIARLKSYAQREGVVAEIYTDYQAGSQVQAEGLRVFLEVWRTDDAGDRHGPVCKDYRHDVADLEQRIRRDINEAAIALYQASGSGTRSSAG
jgi:hypothetical protein